MIDGGHVSEPVWNALKGKPDAQRDVQVGGGAVRPAPAATHQAESVDTWTGPALSPELLLQPQREPHGALGFEDRREFVSWSFLILMSTE